MTLGDFQFSIKTISQKTLTRTTEFKWAETERVGDLPYLQNLGKSKDNIEIDGVFYPKVSGNYQTIDQVRESNLCTSGHNLISDTGGIIGKFVIHTITEMQEFIGKDDKAEKMEFTLVLKRIPDNQKSYVGTNSSLVNTNTDISRSYLKW